MDFKDRIKQRMDDLNLAPADLVAAVKVSKTTIHFWQSGTNKARGKNLLALARALQCDPTWLESGKGNMQPGQESSETDSPSDKDYALIPQYTAFGGCAEDGRLNDHAEIKGGLAFKRDWLAKMKVKPENLNAIYASGESMEPYIMDGDVVLIDVFDTAPRDRQVYAIRRPDGGVSIKRLIQQIAGGWIIRSDNPDKSRFADEALNHDVIHDIPVIGRVIWRGGGIF